MASCDPEHDDFRVTIPFAIPTSTTGSGRDGEPHVTSPKWTWHQPWSCSTARRPYCFEQ